MIWHGAFMMIPINIGQYRSVAVELSVKNLPSLVKSVFGWSVGFLLVGWSLRGRMSHLTPLITPTLSYNSVAAQFNLKSSVPSSVSQEFHSDVTLSLDLGFWALSVFCFCIYRGALLSLIHGAFMQVHSGEIRNIFCIWIKQEDFGGPCGSSLYAMLHLV